MWLIKIEGLGSDSDSALAHQATDLVAAVGFRSGSDSALDSVPDSPQDSGSQSGSAKDAGLASCSES